MRFTDNEYLYEVDGPQRATRSHPARGPEYGNVAARDGWPTIPGAKNLWEMFHNSVMQYPNNLCLGHRPITYGEPGAYVWQTYKEIGEKVDAIAGGIMHLGHQAHGRIGVYGINSPEWMITMQACNRQNAYCVPLYDTLGPDAVEYIIGHAEVTIVFASAVKMRALVEPLTRAKGKVKALIVWGEMDGIAQMDIEEKAGLEVYRWGDFLDLGRAHTTEPISSKPDDLCTLMYTSGTTGNPKGVMLTHSNILSVVAGQLAAINQVATRYGEKFNKDDVMLSYLPLAHIFDRALEEMFLCYGARIGYWRGKIEGVQDDLHALKPTLFIGVPRVFDKLYEGVYEKLALERITRRWIFALALWYKKRQLAAGIKWDQAAPMVDAVVFSKVKARLGGRVRLVCSGSAPLAHHVEEFLKVVMCAPVSQGYGLTETCGSSFIALPETEFIGTVGGPLPLLTFRLEAVPEMGYDPMANPPRGEIIIKGPVVFQGYFKDQQKTDEVLDKDGWFHTGDIGEIAPIGSLKIIDRKKALFKLAQGEYVAPERIESALKKAPVVQQVFVHGNSFESCVVAVVVPDEKALRAALGGEDALKINSPHAKEIVVAALTAAGKEAGLKGYEIPKAVHISAEEWTPENGMLTPTFKIKREVLKRTFGTSLDALYVQLKQKGNGKKPANNIIDVHSRTE